MGSKIGSHRPAAGRVVVSGSIVAQAGFRVKQLAGEQVGIAGHASPGDYGGHETGADVRPIGLAMPDGRGVAVGG